MVYNGEESFKEWQLFTYIDYQMQIITIINMYILPF